MPYHDHLRHLVASKLSQEIQNFFPPESTPTPAALQKNLTRPPQFSLGQFSLPCFPFAKSLKKSPQDIAKMFLEKMKTSHKDQKDDIFQSIEEVNGYLNIHLNFSYLAKQVWAQFQSASFFKAPQLEETEKEKIVVEYSQPNTHKALHVGHLRGLVLGDAVCLILESVGHKIVRATYPGDLGTHVAKILWYINENLEKGGSLPEENKSAWLGVMYAKADEAFREAKEAGTDARIKQQLADILTQITNRKGPMFDLWKTTREWSLTELRDIYQWFNSTFDVWYYESECEKPSKELVIQKYEEGFFVKDNGAIGIDLSDYKLGFAMFLKSDGQSLYLTKDLDLISQKFSDLEITRSICVVDYRQKLHFQQLFKTAELMGYPQASKSVHLAYETVNTEEGKPFSSRALNGISLLELKEKMEEKVKTEFLSKYNDSWGRDKINTVARDVTLGALKYGMLKVDNNTQVHFSLSEWLRLDGETGPYLQYVHARCSSILEKIKFHSDDFEFGFQTDQEKELLFHLMQFWQYTFEAAESYRPSVLAGYLYDCAKLFNRFYEACPIRTAENAHVHDSRLALVQITQRVLEKGLHLLAIPAPRSM